jgi:osmotically-inducible protein OsmY
MKTTLFRQGLAAVALGAALALPPASVVHAGEAGSTMERASAAIGNAAITAQVKARLVADERTRGFDINVDTEADGKVILRGTAPSKKAKRAATEIAKSVSGVSAVRNDLIVAEPGSVAERSAPPATASQHVRRAAQDAGEAGSDAWITTRVKAALLADREVAGLDIKVKTRDGVVHLEGEVDSARIEARAVEIAASIDGVRRVDTAALKVKG